MDPAAGPAKSTPPDDDASAPAPDEGFVSELVTVLRDHKKWWLTPIVLVVVSMVALVLMSATGAAPIFYKLF